MPIPTVQGSDVIAAPYAAEAINSESLMAPGRAMAGLAQAIGYTGQVIGDFAKKKQDVINVATEQDAMTRMGAAFSEYQDEMATQQDEEKWVEGWTKKSESLKNSLLTDSKISQAVKDHLNVALSTEAARSTQRVATQANTRTIQRQKARLTNVANYMYSAGDIERGDIAIEAMREHGLIFPEQEFEMKKQGHEQADFSAVNKGINTDPFTALDQLEERSKDGEWVHFTNLDENRREGLKVEALRRTASVRAETVQGIVDRRNNGELVAKDELQSLVDQRKLKPTEMKWILQEQGRSENDPKLTVEFAKVLSVVDGYDPAKDPTNQHYAELFGQSVRFAPQYREEIQKRLEKRRRPSVEETLTKDSRSYIDELLRGGFLGDVSLQDGKARLPEEYQAAYGKTVELRQKLDGFMRENPNATPTDQKNFINSNIQGTRAIRAATPILNFISGRASQTPPRVITSKAEFDALKKGDRFEYNGRSGTKN